MISIKSFSSTFIYKDNYNIIAASTCSDFQDEASTELMSLDNDNESQESFDILDDGALGPGRVIYIILR